MRLGAGTKVTIVLLHLTLVTLGAFQVKVAGWGLPGAVLDYYGTLSGSNSGYGFFAPGVGTGLRVEFDIVDKQGKITATDRLETAASNREAELRVGNILGLISRNVEDEKVRRSVSASWAGKMFAWHPEAKEVIVRAETFDPPSMERFRNGSRSSWVNMYRARFVRKGE